MKMGGWSEAARWMAMVVVGVIFVVAIAGVVAEAGGWAFGGRWFGKVGRGLLTPTLALATLVVLAGQAGTGERQAELMEEQIRVSGMQWRVAVWEKRYLAYDATMILVEKVGGWSGPTKEQLWDWRAGTRDSGFLFGREVNDLIGELKEKCERLMELDGELRRPLSEVDQQRREEYAEESRVLHEWFKGQKEKVLAVFEEYLSVKEK